VARAVVRSAPNHWVGDWMYSGSDERQYCSPGASLPVVRLCRSDGSPKGYPEYHTSGDDMSVISERGLASSLDMLKDCVGILEANGRYRSTVVGEAHLGRRNLYPTLAHGPRDKLYMHTLSLCDGKHDALDIADRTPYSFADVAGAMAALHAHGLVA